MNVVSNGRRVVVFLNHTKSAGGVQRVAEDLVQILAQRHDVRLLTVEPLGNPVVHDSSLELDSLGYRMSYAGRIRQLLDLARVALRLRRYVAARDVDTVFATWYDWTCIAALLLPNSVVKIGCEHIAFEEAPRFWRDMGRLSFGRLDAVVGLTESGLPELSRVSERALVIPKGVRIPPSSDAVPREKTLLCVGHLIRRKGLDRLLWALCKPLHQYPDWKLVLVGGGENGQADWTYVNYLARLIKQLRLEGRVLLVPATKRIDSWYRRASVCVMGSRQEGFPMVLIEAKAHGLPIVGFDCPTGPREIVRHAIDGYLIQDDDFAAFGEAVEALIKDKALWESMSAAAKEDAAARFAIDSIAPLWLELVNTLHAKRHSAPALSSQR